MCIWAPGVVFDGLGILENPKELNFQLRSSVRTILNFLIFFEIVRKMFSCCGLLGAARCPCEALEAIFVEQRFGLNPREGQGGDGLSPQEGRFFEHPGDQKKIS